MRKANKTISRLLAFIMALQLILNLHVSANDRRISDLLYQQPRQSKGELYRDMSISLLLPYIQKEVNKYYSKYLTLNPMIAPYMIYVLSAERSGFLFNIKLKVYPYVGPHIEVGIDYITLTVGALGDITIEKFEHTKGYQLPPNYQSIIKKGYKNPIP